MVLYGLFNLVHVILADFIFHQFPSAVNGGMLCVIVVQDIIYFFIHSIYFFLEVARFWCIDLNNLCLLESLIITCATLEEVLLKTGGVCC